MVRVKICGITNLRDGKAAVELGADALGFIFAHSPRRITPEKARGIIKALPPLITCVGVFVDEGADKVKGICQYCGLDTVQLHGSESRAYVDCLKEYFHVIKAFRVHNRKNLRLMEGYTAHAFLLDSYERGKVGGTGRTFPWELARAVGTEPHGYSLGALPPGLGRSRPIIIAGGLSPDNVREAIEIARPFGVDVSSGVESSPGKKDRRLVKEFIQLAKSW
jgi:phosphoribosylanthranilate isomerase